MFCKKISITAILLISLSMFSQERVTKRIEKNRKDGFHDPYKFFEFGA